jgi:hypothetical protein|nr:MAG TPA: minor capsid component [Caudoviricetes sp.]
MNSLYKDATNVSSDFTFDDELLKSFIKRVYSKDFHPMTEIEEGMFNAVWDKLNIATDKGFGARTPHDPDYDFYQELRYNNAVFSAFKVHRMQNDMAAFLLDSNGDLKPFEQWANDVMPIADHQVYQWLRTEYDTAIIRAHQAADWKQFEREADVLPNLKWMPSTSVHPGADHREFWGTILPLDDPFWNIHRPGDRWNCKCGLSSTDEEPTRTPPAEPQSNPQGGLENNPGKDAKLFSDKHPYMAEAHPGAKKAVDKLMERIEEMVNEMPDNLTYEEKVAIARHNMELENKLGITKGKPMTVEEADKQHANPKFKKKFIPDSNGGYVDKAGNKFSLNPDYKPSDRQYEINCQTCSPAYALRLRGFDVTAKGKTAGSLSEYLSKQRSFEAWLNIDGTAPEPILTFDWMNTKGYKTMTAKRYRQYFEECCKEEGVYILTIGWRNGGGHATILQRFANGELKYIEPQSYNENAGARRSLDELCLDGATKPYPKRGILRVDNKIFNMNFLSIFNK